MKYYTALSFLTPGRVAIITKSTNNKCWRGCGQKGTLLYCWWDLMAGRNRNGTVTLEDGLAVFYETKHTHTI